MNDESSAEVTQEDVPLRFVSSPSRASCEASSAGVCRADYTITRLTAIEKQKVHLPINVDFQPEVRLVVAIRSYCRMYIEDVFRKGSHIIFVLITISSHSFAF